MFDSRIRGLIDKKRDDNNFFLTREKYSSLVQCVKDAKAKISKQPRRLARYDVFLVADKEKLVKPLNKTDSKVCYYVDIDDLFDRVHNIHVSIGHGGRNWMVEEIKHKYCNITKEVVMICLSLFMQCQKKRSFQSKGFVSKPILSNHINSRYQTGLIDMSHTHITTIDS